MSLIFHNRWVAKGIIGKGAFSEIYIAEDVNNPSERVAVKYQNPDFDASVMRWEGVVMSDLAEVPTVPRMIYHGRDGRRDYLIMELLTGEDMASLRDRCRVGGVRDLLPIEVCSYLTRQMLNSLQAMHEKGYVHRDVKPSNFVRRSKTSTEFCVIDFGLAKQQYSSNGTFRSERETAEFRGTTIYASPYAHAGKDQCPRDDLFSALHVFLDLALGDLPWRAAAKNKNKTAVASLKQDLLTDSDLFLDGIVVQLEESIGDAASQVQAVVNLIREPVKEIISHLKGLTYVDKPDYSLIRNLLMRPVPENKGDAVVGDLNYCAGNFNWTDGISLDDRIAKFGLSSGLNSNSKTGRPDPLENRYNSSIQLNALASSRGSSNNMSIINDNSNNTDSNSGMKPLMKIISEGTRGDYRLMQIRDKLRTLKSDTESFFVDALNAQTSEPSPWSSEPAPPTAPNGSQERPQLELSYAVRWKVLARELVRLPTGQVQQSEVAQEAMNLCYQLLIENDHYFMCKLGEMDQEWAEFSSIQSVVGAFYNLLDTQKRLKAEPSTISVDTEERAISKVSANNIEEQIIQEHESEGAEQNGKRARLE